MTTVNVHEAKTNLSKLLERVERGEDVIIARDGTPVARLVPVGRKRVLGDLAATFAVPDTFFDPLPEEDLAFFGPKMPGRRPSRRTPRR